MSESKTLTDLIAKQAIKRFCEPSWIPASPPYKPSFKRWISIRWSNFKYNFKGFLRGHFAVTIRGKIVDSRHCDD